MKRVFIGLIVFLAVLVAGVYGWRHYLIEDAHKLLLADLTDPDAALFRNVSYVGEWSGRGVVCGEVNTRNRMGGYVGYRRYFVWRPYKEVVRGHYQIEKDLNQRYIKNICDDIRFTDSAWWKMQW